MLKSEDSLPNFDEISQSSTVKEEQKESIAADSIQDNDAIVDHFEKVKEAIQKECVENGELGEDMNQFTLDEEEVKSNFSKPTNQRQSINTSIRRQNQILPNIMDNDQQEDVFD